VAYQILIKDSARKELAALSLPLQKRIDTRIRALSENPRPSGIKKLAGDENLYRLRVGDYRISYQIQDKALLVLVIKISHRREVYRKR
jgi:mRNA interferase RelE/StbE